MEVPIIDFQKCGITHEDVDEEDLKSVGDDIFNAFANIGFAYLKNTGIEWNHVDDMFAVSKEFFDLDLATKQKYNIGKDICGYVGIGVEKNEPGRPGDYKEGFDLSGVACTLGSTNWPDEEVPEFSVRMKDFAETCRVLSLRILRALSAGMKIKDKEFLVNCHSRMNDERNLTMLRTHYYPKIPHNMNLAPDQVRLGAHTDFGCISILFQDGYGLQVKRIDGTYVDARPVPETVVVNVGNALQFWTRGRLKSTVHRICMPSSTKENTPRRSLNYFVRANDEAVLSEIEYEMSANHAPSKVDVRRIRSPTMIEYLKKEYKRVNLQDLNDYAP